MNQKEQLQKQSKIRSLLCKAQLALNEDRYDDALTILNEITLDEMKELGQEELLAIGRLLSYLKDMAEQKKEAILNQLKTVQARRGYLE